MDYLDEQPEDERLELALIILALSAVTQLNLSVQSESTSAKMRLKIKFRSWPVPTVRAELIKDSIKKEVKTTPS